MRFLFDNSFSPRLVNVLRLLDVDAIALRDEFPADITDVELFSQMRGADWVFVTADRQIKRRSAEAKALRECGVSAFFLKRFWVRRQVWEQAEWLTRHWRKLDEFARTAHRPFYAEVDRQGRISQFTI